MAKKKITLKTTNGTSTDFLYPRTAASQVEVTANTTLDSYMKGMVDSISDGTTVVVKEAKKVSKSLKIKNAAGTSVTFDGSAELDLSAGVDYATKAGSADSATNADKLENTSKQSIINAAASKAVDDVGTTLSNSYYTKTEIDGKLQGVGKIDAATTGGAGIVRLATQEEVNSGEVTENIPEGGNPDEPPAVVVTPMTLAKKLENYATPTDVANEVAKIVDNAPEAYDTLKEIAAYITSDTTNAAQMSNAISANTTEITKIKDGTTTVPKATNATTAGSATTATTATNLASAPSLAASGTTQITVTAGGKTSSAFTIPFATKATSADSATSATTAEKATKDSNGNTINFSKDGVETLLNLTYSDDGEVTY